MQGTVFRMNGVIVLVVLVMLLAGPVAWGRVIYVDHDANGVGDGSSWETAYRYLQDALAEAEAAGEPVEIRVAQGTYRPDRSSAHPDGTGDREATFFLVDRTTIKGGYAGLPAGDPNERDIEAYATVLSGDLADNDAEHANPLNAREDPTRADNCYHVISYTAYELDARLTAEIDGCVVSGGYGFERKASAILPTIWKNQGGGLFADFRKGLPVKVTLRRCRFLNNYAEEKGGAFYCRQAEGWQLIDCTFAGNGTHVDGGALYAYFSSLELVRCRFEGNRSDQYGGAMYFSAIGEVTLHCCTLVGNVARGTGGALVIHSGITRCVGCLLKDNVAVMWRGGLLT
jgi:predicted outer membrane repeat protein